MLTLIVFIVSHYQSRIEECSEYTRGIRSSHYLASRKKECLLGADRQGGVYCIRVHYLALGRALFKQTCRLRRSKAAETTQW